jgi:hypothetical protein
LFFFSNTSFEREESVIKNAIDSIPSILSLKEGNGAVFCLNQDIKNEIGAENLWSKNVSYKNF